ncbi:MAG: type II toxin-antitoxin system VapC family toxin [Myxococcota bacterium]
MTRWMLDTDTCIALVNQQRGFLRVVDHLDRIERQQVLISAVTAGELYFGVARSARPDANLASLNRFLAEFEVAPFDEDAARTYGQVRGRLADAGTPIGPLDTMIAGHALSLRARVVTHNVSEFRRVRGLKVVDWLAGPA